MNKKAIYQTPATMYMNIESQVILVGSGPADINGAGGSAGGATGGGPW